MKAHDRYGPFIELELGPPPVPTEIDRIIEQHMRDAADKWWRHVEQVTGAPFVAPRDLTVERVGLTDDESQIVFRATGKVPDGLGTM